MISINVNLVKHLEQAAQRRKRRAKREYERDKITERQLLRELADLDDAVDRFRSLVESKSEGES